MGKSTTTTTTIPKLDATNQPIDVEEESQRLLEEIEQQYSPERCSLATYREVLRSLVQDVRERINQLNDEIGDD